LRRIWDKQVEATISRKVETLGNPSAKVTYYAGPPLANGTAGQVTMNFDLVFSGTSVSHTGTATVQCP
jgi:hypothetical protein